jgi:uncharacterized ferritin-like protein (DUF455 family)
MNEQSDPVHASLTSRAVAILTTAEPERKVSLSRDTAAAWRAGNIEVGAAVPPDHPARPARPELLAPRHMPKRNAGGERAARAALIHAVAHIEFNAMDLAWDLVARFTAEDLPRAFYDDWVGVAAEEAEHFNLVAGRLAELGIAYGDLPAHGGLWQAAAATSQNLAARLAVVPLVLEARGLDVTPAMINRLRSNGDHASVAVLEVIYREEIGHVAVGRRWFDWICARRGRDPAPTYQSLVREHFKGLVKPPFNTAARDQAGFPAAYYEPLAN